MAVQIVYSNRRGSREIEHIGSAHSPADVEVLKTVARQRRGGQDTLDFGDGVLGEDEAPILSSQARHLWEMLGTAYQVLGFDRACGADDVPTVDSGPGDRADSKLDSIRVLTEVGIAAPSYPTIKRRRTIFHQYRADRAKRTLKGIDQQVGKAEKAIAAGPAAINRNRFVQLAGGTRSVNRDLEAKARALAGLKGYVTNLESPTSEYVMGAYHQLWQIEHSFRMSKTDLRARPIYHDKRESIEAHLTIVMAASRFATGSNVRPAGRSRNS